ncbi:MOSC domain-containing protein [Fusarium acuminatum]
MDWLQITDNYAPARMLFIATSAILPILLLLVLFRNTGSSSVVKSLPLPAIDEIVRLRVYPVKSCRGFDVKSSQLLRTGLDLDRNWMFVTAEKNEFITIRTNSKMTLIRTAWDTDTDTLTISLNEHKIEIPAHPTTQWLENNTELKKAGIWGEQTDAWEYSASLTKPISEFLNMDIRLVYNGPTPRILRGSGAPHRLGRTEATNFADMMPVLVASMASMNELNDRLAQAGEDNIDIERFRPNVVIRGSTPWIEDGWKTLQIGEGEHRLNLDVVCRCLRCQVPNVDPVTADKHPRQPWNQLMKYRRIDPGLKFKPSFGMLCAPSVEGHIEVGMKFQVTAMTNDHFFISPMK